MHKRYMKWLTNKRMKAIGLEGVFEKIQNPITWINNWTESKGMQEAPQETEISQYIVGAFNQDIKEDTFDDFDF
jgi:ribonucleotide reductase beta subunit family protein with ferritin-like domain